MAVMTLKALLPIALLVTVAPAPASAQLSRRTFGGLPFWADSALVVSGLGQRFMLSSELNTIYEFGDFDRDGLLDVAVERSEERRVGKEGRGRWWGAGECGSAGRTRV